jgi:hypothetical protein
MIDNTPWVQRIMRKEMLWVGMVTLLFCLVSRPSFGLQGTCCGLRISEAFEKPVISYQVSVKTVSGTRYPAASEKPVISYQLSVISKDSIQHPSPGIQHPASGIQHPAPSIQHPASGIQHPASSIQHPASSIRHPASSIQHPVSSIQHPASFPLLYKLYWIGSISMVVLLIFYFLYLYKKEKYRFVKPLTFVLLFLALSLYLIEQGRIFTGHFDPVRHLFIPGYQEANEIGFLRFMYKLTLGIALCAYGFTNFLASQKSKKSINSEAELN